jgi:hypothetical protein
MDAQTAEETLAAAANGPYQQVLSPAQAAQCALAVLGRDTPPPQIERYLKSRGIVVPSPLVQQEVAEYLERIHLDENQHSLSR